MSIGTYWLYMIVTTLISKYNKTPSYFQSARLVISNECVISSYIAYTLKRVIHQVFTIFYVFSIGAIVNPLMTSCWWYSSACSKGPLHTSAEPSLSTSSASNHDFFSLIPGIILTRQFATCSNVLKLSSRTIILASGYFLFVVFGSTTEVVKIFRNFHIKNLVGIQLF